MTIPRSGFTFCNFTAKVSVMAFIDSRTRADFGNHESKRVDWLLFLLILIISTLGAINLYSATFDPTAAQNSFLFRQLIFMGIGFLLIALALLFDYRLLEHFAYFIYGINLFLVLGTHLFGVMRNGQRLWYNFGIIAYQPSETMKVAMLLALAKYFHSKEYSDSLGLRELFMPLLIVGGATLATLTQPDTGTAMHIFLIGITMILFFGVRKSVILTVLTITALAVPVM